MIKIKKKFMIEEIKKKIWTNELYFCDQVLAAYGKTM